jgi:hypothetical protein
MNISVQFEDSDLHRVLSDMIVHPNKEEYLKLLVPILCESHKASDWFFRLHMGKKLPKVLTKGTMCYIGVKYLGYSASKDEIRNSNLCNDKDQVVCKIKEYRGIHNYNAYTITFTDFDPTGNPVESTCTVSEEDLIEIEEF